MEDDPVTWTASGIGPTTLHHAVIYDEKPRTWVERLFTRPWRPWDKYKGPIAVIDFHESED